MSNESLPYWKRLLERRTTTLRLRAERAELDALAWRGCAAQLAARLYVLNEQSPALANYERMETQSTFVDDGKGLVIPDRRAPRLSEADDQFPER